MNKKCRMAVIGAGVFGGYHAQKCADHPRIALRGVYDKTLSKARALSAKHSVQAYYDYPAMFDDVDAVVIACSAASHGEVALLALRANKHCLIEKPIAATLTEAYEIVKLSEAKGLVVQVGHQERLVVRAIGLDKVSEVPIHITTERMAGYSERGTDVSVTLDLMTHDIDLILMLMGAMPNTVAGNSKSVKSFEPDYTIGKLTWDKTETLLKASRVEQTYSRIMRLTYPSGTVEIDFNAKTLKHDTPFALDANFGNNPMAKDSLGAATDLFVRSVLDGDAVIVSAQDGYNALKIAQDIDGGNNA